MAHETRMTATDATGGTAEELHARAARARRILLHEQHTGHADAAVKPGGLEAFVTRWAGDLRTARAANTSPTPDFGGAAPEDAIVRLITGYRALDPMQRAARVRSALALLDSFAPPPTPPLVVEAPAGRSMPPKAKSVSPSRVGEGSGVRSMPPARRAAAPTPPPRDDEPWPLATPPPPPPRLARTPDADHERPRPRPEDEYLLRAPVTSVPGVGSTQAARLAKLGIETVRDLLSYFPREHRDYSKLQKIATLPFDEVCTVLGLIWEVQNSRISGGRTRTIARISDETGAIRASWFNQPYLLKQLPRGAYIVITGVKQRFGNRVELSVRSHELPEQGDLINTGRLVPVYGLTEGLHPKALRRFTKWAVDRCAAFLPDHLPPAVRARARLMPLPEAVAQMHYPDSDTELAGARRRLAFDELFLIQLGMLTRRANWQDGPPATPLPAPESLIFTEPSPDGDDSSATGLVGASSGRPPAEVERPPALGGGLWPLTATCFERTLPFSFTGAQRRAIREILADMRTTKPMSRLLQGDVGSGKTAVAAAALLACAANGCQGALLAPTEILAEQHYRSLSALLAPFGLSAVLLTGSQRAKERTAARDAMANGQAAVAIGTHALIQDDIAFKRLGLTIVDEQHRFGVEQRDALRRKGLSPHMLVMTATPIPRTLALTLYGDLDVSVLDEMPAGRQPIITRWRSGGSREEAYRLVEEEVANGRQAYIICPLVEESETLEAKSAIAEYDRLKREVFPDLRLGLVHGQVKAAEKDRVMRAFRDGEIDVLVATAVVEVGVDVPNATVMLIEDADRFGLSQLHQFRGRVGRGQHQSYCYLLSQEAGMTARERLSVMERTNDGFALADEDLRLRGPGDFFGTRQSGLPELKVAKLADTQLLVEARTHAEWLWEQDPYLKALEHAALRERVFLFWRDFAAH
ncbi:MAG TPA: ATP-dependent DNA helicase RecG [Ktedonobacterales bacterium]|nr:ATP-dependent DNA helicase RecG [Ktedonobacterales bacterium]